MGFEGINYESKPCGRCNGKGHFGTVRTGLFNKQIVTCGACNGSGSVLVASPARKCGLCNGSGSHFGGKRMSPKNYQECHACNGTGWANPK
jgi:DnaJ-class molecular chaperone